MSKASPSPISDDGRQLPTVLRGHDEPNLAEFPFMLLAKKPPEGVHTFTYEDTDTHPLTGVPVHRKVTITGSPSLGLPNGVDEDILLALMYVTLNDKSRKYLETRTVPFNIPQILKIVDWSDTGGHYERVKESIKKWKSVNITFENWWDSETSSYKKEDGWSILDNYQFRDSRRRESSQLALPLDETPSERMQGTITWNQVLINSFKSGGLRSIDLGTYLSLPNAAAKRAYRYLNMRLPASGAKNFDLEAFATQHVGYSKNYKPSRLRSEVQQAIVVPLEAKEFIEPLPAKSRYHKLNGRDHVVFARRQDAALLFEPAAIPAAEGQEAFTLAAEPAQPSAAIIAELRKRGLGGKVAASLAGQYPAAYIEEKIDFLDFVMVADPPRKPAAWLRKAIEDDYGPPAGYLSRAEREKQAVDQLDKQRQEQEAAASRLREREQGEHDKRIRKIVAERLEAMTREERAKLDADSRAAADPASLEGENGPMKSMMVKIRLATYLRQQLEAENALPLMDA